MSTYRTPLRRARGLGSAKHGVTHWIAERVAAVALVPLGVWLGYAILTLARLDYYGAIEWVGHTGNAILLMLTLAISFVHMAWGLRVVIEDYVEKPLTKATLLIGNLFLCGLAGVLAIFSILKVALGGA